jgi:two-component system response regulator (stage 0 sporulation protein F)
MDKPPKVLVVDDEAGVRLLLELVFGEEGYQVDSATNGLQALQKVRSFQPDVVIMDVKMPVMDGLEALPRIKALSPQTKVIIITAYLEAANVKQVWERGASGFLFKPFDLEDIKGEVHRVLKEKNQAYGA